MKQYNGYLPNYPDINSKAEKIAKKLTELTQSKETHFADCGCLLNSYSKQLQELSKELFALHNRLLNGKSCYVICEGSPVNGRLEIAVFEPVAVGNGEQAATYQTEEEARKSANRFIDTVECAEDHVICPAYVQGDNIQVWEVIEGRYYEVYNGPIIPER
jgi:hypothetical protein